MKKHSRTGKDYIPSSTLNRTLASGLKAIAAMFLRFSKGKVYDLLLPVVEKGGEAEENGYSLDEIEKRNPVSHWAQDGVSIRGEDDIALPVHRAAEVGELNETREKKQ